MSAKKEITKRSTMQEILEFYPSAQRALFRRFHIGGCHSCGYQPEDLLEEVAHHHNITDLDEVIEFIKHAERIDQQIQISPSEAAEALRSNSHIRLIDVRTPEEWKLARIQGAILNTEELAQEMMLWPKDTSIIFYCHFGRRSLDAATYFVGHDFSDARSMTGGIDAWAQFVDSSVPRYERASSDSKAMLRPLRSIVSKAAGCLNQEVA